MKNALANSLIYLASPYSDPDSLVQEMRFRQICQLAGELLKRGHKVFSPIAHGYPIAKYANLPGNYEQWDALNRLFLARCDGLWVADMSGWQESRGVTAELLYAEQLGKPIKIINHNYETKPYQCSL